MKGASASVKSSVNALCRPEFTVGTIVIELGNLDAMKVIGYQGAGD